MTSKNSADCDMVVNQIDISVGRRDREHLRSYPLNILGGCLTYSLSYLHFETEF